MGRRFSPRTAPPATARTAPATASWLRGDSPPRPGLHAVDRSRRHARPTSPIAPTMLGASSALLQGKILRGGMGTGHAVLGTDLDRGPDVGADRLPVDFSLRGVAMTQDLTTAHGRDRQASSWSRRSSPVGRLLIFAALSLFGGSEESEAASKSPGNRGSKSIARSIDFGDVAPGQTVEATFVLTNVGDQPLRLTEPLTSKSSRGVDRPSRPSVRRSSSPARARALDAVHDARRHGRAAQLPGHVFTDDPYPARTHADRAVQLGRVEAAAADRRSLSRARPPPTGA